MASATAKPQKRLRDFLNEQQEPFILEVYLSEREYLKRSSNSSEKSTSLNKRRKALLPFCKALAILHNKLGCHSESNILKREHDQRKRHATVTEPGRVDHVVQFSSASGSIEFNSCPYIGEGTSISPHKDHNSFSSHIFQTSNACNKKRRQRPLCIEGNPESLGKIPLRNVLNVNEIAGGMQQRVRNCHVILPKKITEESLLSAAVWSLEELLPGHDVSQILKSKRALHKIKKQLLFDCVRDIRKNFPTKEDKKHDDYKQFMGLELGKIICLRTEDVTMDYLNSMIGWSKFESHVYDIGVDITDAILESINNEIVSEMVGTLIPNI